MGRWARGERHRPPAPNPAPAPPASQLRDLFATQTYTHFEITF